jgi:hypothetical protein
MVTVRSVEYLGGYRLRLVFSDGASGDVDLEQELWGPVFEPLRDRAEFRKVRVNKGLGTIMWPNGADIAPETLHDWVQGEAAVASK